MKNLIISISLVVSCSFFSCNNERKIDSNEYKPEVSVTDNKQDRLMDGYFVHSGDTLFYKFDNVKSNVVLNYKGEQMTLKQDTMASGIKYSNDNYAYNEHQGKVTLTKDGNTIFSHQR